MMPKLYSLSLYRVIQLLFLPLAVLFLGTGCFDDDLEGQLFDNQPPRVTLVSGPPEGSETNYRIHFYWHGHDTDGDILYFEYAITDNEGGAFNPADTTGRENWTRTTEYDLEFIFSADEIADTSSSDMITKFQRSHTFFVRAVDNQGLASTKPAYRSFTATTLSPTVDIIIPEYPGPYPAMVPMITNFEWIAVDYIDNTTNTQNPDSVRWILLDLWTHDDVPTALDYIRNNLDAPEWSSWQPFLGPNGQSWTTPPLDRTTYVFAVQAKDEAGAVTPVFDLERNVRWIWPRDDGWPLLKLRNDFFGTITTSIDQQKFLIATMPAGIDLDMEIYASADAYGGTIEGYRYGWDLPDFDTGWTDWISYPGGWVQIPVQAFFFGTHTFSVEIRDTSGFTSRINLKFNVIPFTLEKPLLVVDDFAEENSIWAGLVSDQAHDDFWSAMTQNVDGFNPLHDMVEVGPNVPLPITALAQYKSVIWNVHGGPSLPAGLRPMIHEYVKYAPEDTQWPYDQILHLNPLALYMAAGGHVLICGEQPMGTSINPDYLADPNFPVILEYELAGDQDGDYNDQMADPAGDQSFPFRDMCLSVLDLAYPGGGSLRTSVNGCDVTPLRDSRPREDGLREAVPEDLSFPNLTLRPEFTQAGAIYDPDVSGLQSELYNPAYFSCGQLDLGPRACWEPIYKLGCLDASSNIYLSPVAMWSSAYGNVVPDVAGGLAARSAVWGFEPFFFDTTAVRTAVEVILFNEWQLPRK